MKKNLVNIDSLEIEPLSDEELSMVGGGADGTTTSTIQTCSCQCCTSGTGKTANCANPERQAG